MELKRFARAEKPEPCLILCIDLQNSTEFFKTPDAGASVTNYLNALIGDLNAMMKGRPTSIDDGSSPKAAGKPMPPIAHSKFLGDGFLLIWELAKVKGPSFFSFLEQLTDYQRRFTEFNHRVLNHDVNALQVPNAIRFGLTAGGLRRLVVDKRKPHLDEWIGPGINRAARLQGYCKEIGLIVHDIHVLTHADLGELDLVKVVAKKMKSHEEKVLVYVDSVAYRTLSETSAELFELVEHV